jgi:hypothetical protein
MNVPKNTLLINKPLGIYVLDANQVVIVDTHLPNIPFDEAERFHLKNAIEFKEDKLEEDYELIDTGIVFLPNGEYMIRSVFCSPENYDFKFYLN